MAAPCSGPRSTPPRGAAEGPSACCGEGLIPALPCSASWLVTCPYIIGGRGCSIGGRGLFLPPSSPSLALLAASRPVPPRRSVRLRSLAAGGVLQPVPLAPLAFARRACSSAAGGCFPLPHQRRPVPPHESSISRTPSAARLVQPARHRPALCLRLRPRSDLHQRRGCFSPGPLAPASGPFLRQRAAPPPPRRGSLTQARVPAYLPLSKFRPRRIEREYGRPPGRNRSCPRNCARRAAPN